jgi:hypothetical protein
MTKAKKIGIILILVGLCLPTATLPFITEFHPQPNICLTSNFFGNLGNMVVVFGAKQLNISGTDAGTMYGSLIAIPYKYLFALGVILVGTGLGVIILSPNKIPAAKS